MTTSTKPLGEWHRIDDPENPAPKDGTEVVLYARTPGGIIICNDWWSDRTNWWCDWYEGHSHPPTHWRTVESLDLPNPPEKERT